jgi:peptidyl-prolyl cis-trans isomerase C
VQAWYLRHQAQFMRPEQRLTRHLLLTVDGDDQAVYSRIRALSANRSLPRGVCAAGPATLPLPERAGRRALGWIGRGLLYPQLEEALFALAENALSAPWPASSAGIWSGVRPFALPRRWRLSRRWKAPAIISGNRASSRHQRQWLAEMLARQPGLCG